jgi:DNA-binding transcriptional LysR family regulator
MTQVLDIVAMRSLVAVSDCGGFHRAATVLQISQPAVSQHVRRLEKVVGRPLVAREGRRACFTLDGQALLLQARRILAVHDEALRRITGADGGVVVVGATEHAAERILPAVTAGLLQSFPHHEVRFRIDRSARLDDAVDRGGIDLAVGMTEATGARAVPVGSLPLTWYCTPGWEPPAGGPLPVVAVEEPCLLRRRGLQALAERRIEATVVCDTGYVTGVVNAVRAGIGVALLPGGTVPEGLVVRTGLPPVAPVALGVRARRGADPRMTAAVVAAVRELLAAADPAVAV